MISDAITELLEVGSVPAADGGAADEAEMIREATEDRAKVMVREVRLPVAARMPKVPGWHGGEYCAFSDFAKAQEPDSAR